MVIAKKSLGQNFLIDKNIIDKILSSSEIENKSILEIGPGTGNLTTAILKKNPKKFYVVEKDNSLTVLLEKEFGNKLSIINGDILKINEKDISKEKLTVFGNLPYNISTEIICRWIVNLDNFFWFDKLILMFQKEVADRILAESDTKNYGRLSVLANWKLDIKKICDVSPASFSPKPKIDSSVLKFEPKKKFFNFKKSSNLEYITRVFFNHRRKMIKKPFNVIFNGKSEIAEKLNIDLNLRPQNLSLNDYFLLTEEYEKLTS